MSVSFAATEQKDSHAHALPSIPMPSPSFIPHDTSSTAASASSSSSAPPAPPTRGLLLRVKRRRHETPLDTLIVSSERAEKRAMVGELREKLERTGLQQQEDAAASAAAAASSSSASASSTTALASPTSASAASSTPSLFRSRPSSHSQRVFRLLTSTSAPKEAHSSDAAIVARINTLRARAGLGSTMHPSIQATSEDTHRTHVAAQSMNAHEKRQAALMANRAKLNALQQDHQLAPELVYNSSSLQLQIVDITLGQDKKQLAAARTTFEPPPVNAEAARRATERSERAQRTALEKSSHQAGTTKIDPQEAAQQFAQAMSVIKKMPGDRKQMDAFKGLIEDYLSTLPENETTTAAAASSVAKATPSSNITITSSDSSSSSSSFTPSNILPSTNKIAPKIPQRRKKTNTNQQPVIMQGDTIGTSAAAASSSSAAASSSQPTFTAGGVAYDPSQLVQATARSLHKPAPANSSSSSMQTVDEKEDDGEFVYDVYHLPDDAADVDATSANNEEEDYKSHYHGASSAYITLQDGLIRWIGGGDQFVNEEEQTDDDEDAALDEDEAGEMSDYGNSSEEEDQEEERDAYDPIDPRSYRDSWQQNGGAPGEIWEMSSSLHQQHGHQIVHLKKTAPKQHGFFADDEQRDEEEDEEENPHVRQVRRAMAAGSIDLSSDEDEDEAGRRRRTTQDDDDYLDAIEDEQAMEDEEHDEDEEDD